MNHPREHDLALLAGGEAGRLRHFLLDRHVHSCADCRQKVAEYRDLRDVLAQTELPDVNWNFLAADMRANIRLGLEAGACVRHTQPGRRWNPRPVFALACVLLVVIAGELLRDARPHRTASDGSPVLESTNSGIQLRTGANNSLTLLNRNGSATSQTVSARGDISARYIDSETGSVTINDVSLQ
jgi:hypothetical protein